MLKILLCKINLGHHWVAESDRDGNFSRYCLNCGKVDRHGARWSQRLSAGDHPTRADRPDIPSSDV
jgi:hypothetical protein